MGGRLPQSGQQIEQLVIGLALFGADGAEEGLRRWIKQTMNDVRAPLDLWKMIWDLEIAWDALRTSRHSLRWST